MADDTQILKLLMEVRADVADFNKVTGGLKEVQAQAIETAAAVNSSSSGFGINQTQTGSALSAATALQAENAAAAERNAKWAAVQAREMAAQVASATELQSLTTGLGNAYFFAGFAAVELFHFISDQVEETRKLNEEFRKFSGELDKVNKEWVAAASRAQTFADTVKFAEKVKQELDKMSRDMDAFREKQLPAWERFWDAVATGWAGRAVGPYQAGRQNQASGQIERDTLAANEAIDKNIRATKEWAAAQADLRQGYEIFNDRLKASVIVLEAFDAKRKADPTNRKALDEYIAQLGVVNDLKDKVDQLGTELDKHNKTRKEAVSTEHEITALVREQANLLARIRSEQQIVQQNPFTSIDQKNAQMVPLLTSEIAALNAEIAKGRAAIAGGGLDPAEYQQVLGKIQQTEVQVQLLGFKLATLKTPMQGMRAELTNWVNSFGSAVHQIAGLITGTLNTAISATSQAITGLIFGTKNWKQAFAQAAQSIVQNIIQILLQLIVSQTIAKALSTVFKSEQVAEAEIAGTATATAWAPAAAFVSVATEGAADVAGTTGLAAAVAAAFALGVGGGGAAGAAEGWYVDRGSHSTADDVPVRVSRGEGIINAREVARRGGKAWVDSINTGVSRSVYASGGIVGGSGGSSIETGSGDGGKFQVHIFNFTDHDSLRDAILKSNAAKKIINDTVLGNRVTLGF